MLAGETGSVAGWEGKPRESIRGKLGFRVRGERTRNWGRAQKRGDLVYDVVNNHETGEWANTIILSRLKKKMFPAEANKNAG